MSTIGEDIFRSPAGYYTRSRKPYLRPMFELVHDKFQLGGQGDLLDVGCGTGHIALPLSKWFRRVVGVDLSGEMVAAARQNAAALLIDNAEFHTMPGEDISSLVDEFSLVTYGSALHWTDVPKTLAASNLLLTPGGGVAILGMRSIWGEESDWERLSFAWFRSGWAGTGGLGRALLFGRAFRSKMRCRGPGSTYSTQAASKQIIRSMYRSFSATFTQSRTATANCWAPTLPNSNGNWLRPCWR